MGGVLLATHLKIVNIPQYLQNATLGPQQPIHLTLMKGLNFWV